MDRVSPCAVFNLEVRRFALDLLSGVLFRTLALVSFATIAGGLATPAHAAREPNTRLVRCGGQSCLLVSGHRDDPASIVRINGQAVSVEGRNGWEVRLPLGTVRALAAPHARTIEVSLHDREAQREGVATVDLPIGLLGNVTTLETLEVRAR